MEEAFYVFGNTEESVIIWVHGIYRTAILIITSEHTFAVYKVNVSIAVVKSVVEGIKNNTSAVYGVVIPIRRSTMMVHVRGISK